MKILAWDIETAPNLAWVWGLWDQNVGLNQIDKVSSVMSFAARWIDEPKRNILFHSDFTDGHEGMVTAAWELINEADALVSWNGKAFDTKHMNREFLLAGLTPTSPTKEIDLLQTSRRMFKFPSNKLEYVATALGLSGKIKHSGFELWKRCMNGDEKAWAEMAKYNKQDVHLLVDLYEILLPWIAGHPNRNLYDGNGCSKCGADTLQKRGTRATGLGIYQRYQCTTCGAWNSSGKSLGRVDIREDR